MYRLGHTGIALLVLAPPSYVLLEAHKPLLALITALGVLGVEPFPDFDFKLSFLTHRGVSHSLLAAVSIGGISPSVAGLSVRKWLLFSRPSSVSSVKAL